MAKIEDIPLDMPSKKKGRKLALFLGVPVVLIGTGGGAGVYAMQSGWFSVVPADAHADEPKLVPKSEEKRASSGGEDGGESHGKATPKGEGGDKFASSYYPMEKEFTSNLRDSVHFIQVGVAVSTAYDERVLDNLRTHEIAVRSAVLMTLGETTEEDVFTAEGKKLIQDRLAKAINAVLKEKEGFGGIGNVYFTNFIVQ